MKKNCCPICLSKSKLLYTGKSFFNHIDFQNLNKTIKLYQCLNCYVVFNDVKINNYFISKKYKNSNQTNQRIKNNTDNKYYYRSELQTKLIKSNLKLQKIKNIIDIGSFDGRLLYDISKSNKKIKLYGFDLTIPKKNFYNKKIKYTNTLNLNIKFDLVILSHSLFYFENLNYFFKKIKKIISLHSKIIIQVPDIKMNPFNLFLGDQKYYFTKSSLKNIFKINNFNLKIIKNSYFERDLVFIAEYSIKDHKKLLVKKDKEVENTIINLKKLIEKTRVKQYKNISIFGTTSSAAFLDNILNKYNNFFVDENPKSQNRQFRNKKIYHPKYLDKNHLILLPFFKRNNKLLKILNKKYKPKFENL